MNNCIYVNIICEVCCKIYKYLIENYNYSYILMMYNILIIFVQHKIYPDRVKREKLKKKKKEKE